MKRYVVTLALALCIILIYQFANIRLFAFDSPRRISNELFTTFGEHFSFDTTLIILNTGKLSAEEVKSRIDTLLTYEPAIIGINLCDFEEKEKGVFKSFTGNERVVMGNCDKNSQHPLSGIVEDENFVTHFKSDNPQAFEVALINAWPILEKRGHEVERIYFRDPSQHFWQIDLYDLNSIRLELLRDKNLLIGYKGDYTLYQDEIEDFRSCRITPLNEFFGEMGAVPDMYDIQISANIISTIQGGDFITEINPFLRVGVLLLICILNVILITLVQTRWLVVNLLLDLVIYIALIMLGTFLIVLFFSKGYHIELNELIVLVITVTLFTSVSIYREKKVKEQQP